MKYIILSLVMLCSVALAVPTPRNLPLVELTIQDAVRLKNKGDVPKVISKAVAVSLAEAELSKWNDPHGQFMQNLHAKIIKAEKDGDTKERDKLMRIYKGWADKYLDPANPIRPTK